MTVPKQAEPSALPAQDDWDEHWGAFSCAVERSPAQAYRRALALFLAGRDGQPRRLLDIGCGTGDLLAAAGKRWPSTELAGIDLSEVGIGEARRKVPSGRFRVVNLLDDEGQPHGDEARWATHAVCCEVLEHVDDPVGLLRSAQSRLAPGCRMVITVPGGPMSAFDRHIGHRRHFTPADLGEVMRAAGFEVALLAGAGFPFFNLYRMAVIMRGDRLIDDGAARSACAPRVLMVRAVLAAFWPLMPLSLPRSRFGWQTVGVCRLPAD